MALTKRAVVEAAGAILDEFGLADLSMRRVAEVLGVQPGALYYHVPNKQSLLSAVADEILHKVPTATSLTAWALGYRQALLAHRDAAELVLSSRAVGLGEVDPTEPVRHLLPDDIELAALATVEHFVLGSTLYDQTRAQLAALGVLSEFDADEAERNFAEGIAILERGIGITISDMA